MSHLYRVLFDSSLLVLGFAGVYSAFVLTVVVWAFRRATQG